MLKTPTTSPITFAFKLLSLRNHSRAELERELLKKGFAPENIWPLLEKLTREGVLNDRIFSMELIRSRTRQKPAGKMKMRAELRKKGISDEIVEELLKEYQSEELCLLAAKKKIGSLHGATEAIKKKRIELFLHNRGFAWQEIQAAIRSCFQAGTDDEETC